MDKVVTERNALKVLQRFGKTFLVSSPFLHSLVSCIPLLLFFTDHVFVSIRAPHDFLRALSVGLCVFWSETQNNFQLFQAIDT